MEVNGHVAKADAQLEKLAESLRSTLEKLGDLGEQAGSLRDDIASSLKDLHLAREEIRQIAPLFVGQIALVTGGTRGIGKAIASELYNSGAKVIITGSSEFSDAGEWYHSYYQVDFTQDDSVQQFLSELKFIPKIDVLVNNAGRNIINSIEESKAQDWDTLVRINLNSAVLITQAVSSKMIEHGYGRIVNISSIMGNRASLPGRALYSATKSGLEGLTVGCATDLASKGDILVNAVAPGYTFTEMNAALYSDEQREALRNRVPLHRLADPNEIAKAVLFLASNLNTYTTGETLLVDGGFSRI